MIESSGQQNYTSIIDLVSDSSGLFPFPVRPSLLPLVQYLSNHLAVQKNKSEFPFHNTLLSIIKEGNIFEDPDQWSKSPALLGAISQCFFPFFERGQKVGCITQPFFNAPLYLTAALAQIIKDENKEMFFHISKEEFSRKMILDACQLILKQCYQKELPPTVPLLTTIRDRKIKLEKHYHLTIQTDFIEVVSQKPLINFNYQKVSELLKNPSDVNFWLQHFPVKNFTFEGIALIYFTEVTDQEILTRLRSHLLDQKVKPDPKLIEKELTSFLNMPFLKVAIHNSSPSLLDARIEHLFKEEMSSSIFGQAIIKNQSLIIDDLQKVPSHDRIGIKLNNKDIASLLFIPFFDLDQRLSGAIEIGSPENQAFTQQTLIKLEAFLPLMKTAFNHQREELENKIRAITLEHFTNIHPSVQWKFREASIELLINQKLDDKESQAPPSIIFKKVFPLYGQADIVGSSTIRSEVIQADVLENFNLATAVLDAILSLDNSKQVHHLIGQVNLQIKMFEEHFSSSDESRVLDFFTKELHPFFDQLKNKVPQSLRENIDNYFSQLDPQLNIISNQRKAFEESTRLLNSMLSGLVVREDKHMQDILPHYFEKYVTDGIEYNLYLGQSLLLEHHFSDTFLEKFRFWQLLLMCRITKKVAAIQADLPLPLSTAQLIFVYNSLIDIRFRIDEKHFDIDGAYNVRYEILKKRIDKAHIEKTGERLTKSGKIAIVYLQDKDKVEYLKYLKELQSQGYITNEIEDFRLAKMQGVEGLKALRVTVLPD